MQRYICIHGHFYQPPRENPWLEAIETQDSAQPYHDWNERITVECYAPNASSRILDENDRIRYIINNYALMSFNFGPTLLSWMESHAPDTYISVIEADRMSRESFSGHGSAMAQTYNHIILPLANARDQQTQVRWGIRDFEARFGRKPEGMWLAETAVDIASLEALAAEGIVFTVLEPHQARETRLIGTEEWQETNGGLDPTRVYRCPLPSGRSIDLFFYDGPISRGVAFENLLARGENLAHRLVGAFYDAREHPQLVNIATDGETYGHHHRFGEMALSYALRYIEDQSMAGITNYSEFRERHPAEYEAAIVENTAWSCSHGVERWRSDCGCSTGAASGWNQRWRAPLRDALDWLRDECVAIFEGLGHAHLADPWAARDDYIDVILDRSDASLERFLSRHATTDQVTTILELLEMQRNAMLMYTSCGWFFSDVSGIETVQVLAYACRVIQLVEKLTGRSLEPEFLERLSPAQSNIPERGTARAIYERQVLPMRVDLRRVAAHYAVASLFDTFEDEAEVYCYRIKRDDFEVDRAGRARLAIARITVQSLITREAAQFEFAVLHLGETELTGGVRPAGERSEYDRIKRELLAAMEPGGIPAAIRLIDDFFAETPLSIRSLFRDEQRRILNILCTTTLVEAESAFRQLHERYDPLMRFHARLGVPLPKVLQTAAEFDVNLQLRRLLDRDPIDIDDIESRLREAQEERVTLDEMTLLALKRAIERTSTKFRQRPDDLGRLESFDAIMTVVNQAGLYINLRQPQNDYYRMRLAIRRGNGAPIPPADDERWTPLFEELGKKLSISPQAGEE